MRRPEEALALLARPPHRRRPGFTLLELMLVLVVMVIIASLALPAVGKLLESQKVDKGADLVRGSLGRARVSAIRTGKVHAFVYRAGSSGMAVLPLDSLGVGGNLDALFTAALDENRSSDADASDRMLPRAVQFVSSTVIDNNRSAAALETSEAQPGNLQYVLFYPDGTSQEAQLTIANRLGRSLRITVRGLTGTSRISRVEAQR